MYSGLNYQGAQPREHETTIAMNILGHVSRILGRRWWRRLFCPQASILVLSNAEKRKLANCACTANVFQVIALLETSGSWIVDIEVQEVRFNIYMNCKQ